VIVNVLSNEGREDSENIAMSPLLFWVLILVIIIMLIFLLITSIVYITRLRNFRFNDIYLIYKDGLLIAHASRSEDSKRDSDIISSMFTAIQDFIQESFTRGSKNQEKSTLKKLDFGDFQIVINRGKYIYIAAIFSGFALRKMLIKIENLRKEIEERFSEVLPTWKGNMSQFKESQELLEELLYSTGSNRISDTKSHSHGNIKNKRRK